MSQTVCASCGQLLSSIPDSESWARAVGTCSVCGRPITHAQTQTGGPKNIPTSVPGLIGSEYDKAIVVIISYDLKWSMFNTSTYGTTPGAKDLAAQWAGKCIEALGGDLKAKQVYEDFHATPEAVYKAQVDELRQRVVEQEAIIEALKKQIEKRNQLVVM